MSPPGAVKSRSAPRPMRPRCRHSARRARR